MFGVKKWKMDSYNKLLWNTYIPQLNHFIYIVSEKGWDLLHLHSYKSLELDIFNIFKAVVFKLNMAAWIHIVTAAVSQYHPKNGSKEIKGQETIRT